MGISFILCGAAMLRTISLGEPFVVPSTEPGYATVLLENTRRASPQGHPLLPLVPVVFAMCGEAGEVSVQLDDFAPVPLPAPVEPASSLRPIGSDCPRVVREAPEIG